jgi:uncharacterized protein (DUF433 family)
VVKEAVSQTYTYYSSEQPEGEVVENAPLAGRGKAWTLGSYLHPTYPSPLNVRVGNAGIKVWMVVGWLRQANGDKEALLSHHGQVLEAEDLDAAVWHYSHYKDAIDEKVAEESEPA